MTWSPNADPRAFLAGIAFDIDVRQSPNHRHRGQFRHQWRRGARGETVDASTLLSLTWANLGFRAGSAYGAMSDEMIDDVFEAFADVYRGAARERRSPR